MSGQTSPTLTAKQAAFVREYLIDLNATQAATRAGYSAKTANEQGARLLANVSVSQAVAAAMDARAQRTEITQDMVLRELARIGFGDIRKVIRWASGAIVQHDEAEDEFEGQPHGGALKRSRMGEGANLVEIIGSDELDEDAAACISEISQTTQGLKVKLYDKQAALVNIGRHLGMFTDKVEHNVSADLAAIIAARRAKVQDIGNGE